MGNLNETPDEEMSVTIDLDDGTSVECTIITILEVKGKEYIALLPMVDEDDDLYGDVWLYGYKENPSDPNEEPELIYIDDEDEYEAAADKFDEYLDSLDFEDQ